MEGEKASQNRTSLALFRRAKVREGRGSFTLMRFCYNKSSVTTDGWCLLSGLPQGDDNYKSLLLNAATNRAAMILNKIKIK